VLARPGSNRPTFNVPNALKAKSIRRTSVIEFDFVDEEFDV
jgi:hypothetical protein